MNHRLRAVPDSVARRRLMQPADEAEAVIYDLVASGHAPTLTRGGRGSSARDPV